MVNSTSTAVIFRVFGFLSGSVGGGIAWSQLWKKKLKEELSQPGIAVNTPCSELGLSDALTVNGRHLYVFRRQCKDPDTNRIHLFKSESLRFNS